MIKINRHRLDLLMDRMNETKICVIGDLMIDKYYWGNTSRISPEAPVPVVDVYKEEFKPGGAANVALNLQSLYILTSVFGVLGNDDTGKRLLEKFKKLNIISDGIVIDETRPTTVKSRVLAAGQHIVRFDNESCKDLTTQYENLIIANIKKNIDDFSAIILEDYNKGLMTPRIIEEVIKIANEKKIIITVDPKVKNYQFYKNATIFKPNLREAEDILNREISTEAEIKQAGLDLLELMQVKYLLITLSDRGMALFSRKNKEMRLIPAMAAKIANVSGAGDTVIATLTAALSVNAQIEEACTLANYAASVVVENVNIVPITRDLLFGRLVDAGVVLND